MKLFDSLLSLLAPFECLGCQAEGKLICPKCRQRLAPPKTRCYKCHTPNQRSVTCPECLQASPLRSVHAATSYDGTAKALVWKLKFGRTQAAATELAQVMADRLQLQRQALPDGVVVTHVPTAASRVRQRGYDQAQLIARALSREAGLAYSPLLGRSGHQKQVGASKVQRSLQLQHAFRAIRPNRVRGRHILLIDDVVTTGATLEAAARVLLAAGASRVDAIVFAQA